jgi:hypothetical protein
MKPIVEGMRVHPFPDTCPIRSNMIKPNNSPIFWLCWLKLFEFKNMHSLCVSLGQQNTTEEPKSSFTWLHHCMHGASNKYHYSKVALMWTNSSFHNHFLHALAVDMGCNFFAAEPTITWRESSCAMYIDPAEPKRCIPASQIDHAKRISVAQDPCYPIQYMARSTSANYLFQSQWGSNDRWGCAHTPWTTNCHSIKQMDPKNIFWTWYR